MLVKKKIAVIVLAAVSVFALCFNLKHGVNSDSNETTEKEQFFVEKDSATSQKAVSKVKYENEEGLYFLAGEGLEEFKHCLEKWLMSEGIDAKSILIHEKIDGEAASDVWTFYCGVNDGGFNVKGISSQDGFQFFFVDNMPETESGVQNTVVSEMERKQACESYDPTSGNEDVGTLVLLNREKFPDTVDEQEFTIKVSDELLKAGEYRREVNIKEVKEELGETEILLEFQIPRVDGKELQVTVKGNEYLVYFVSKK